MSVSTPVDDIEILEISVEPELLDHTDQVVLPTSAGAHLPAPPLMLPLLAIEVGILAAIVALAFFLTSGAI
ncbi:MAG: hypothetical protein HKN94_16560 [Acidimicrobiales bacterium]|nr:hypothetical protein [Acidimicrobiales bacterium]RZV40896.1 MAG: hypothetical protein EX269_17060 [Acidimicrobiales bacterium]